MSDTINPDTGEATQGRSPRFTMWVAFLVFATITLGSSVEVKNEQGEDASSASKYAVACSAVTFTLTAIVVALHLSPLGASMFVGTKIEGITIIILTALWAAIVSIVTNTGNDLATSSEIADELEQCLTEDQLDEFQVNEVQNGNLYYFSWAGFVTSVILLINYLREAFGVDVVGEVRNRSARLTLWAGMLASALVVMGSSARIFQDENCGEDDDAYCTRTKYAVSLGAVGVFFSMAVVAMKMLTTSAPFVVEFAIAFLLVVMNTFGVAYITSAKGPGSSIGNLYYFSWISFLCSAFLTADCFNQYTGGGGTAATGADGTSEDKQNGDIEVETFDDAI